MTIKMVSHAFRMLFSNFSDALKLSLVPYVLIQAVSLGVPFFILGTVDTDPLAQEPVIDPSYLTVQLFVAIGSIVFGAWLAVNWHRFVLVEDYPNGFVPPFRSSEVFLYLGKLILLFLLALLFVVPMAIVGAVASGFATADPTGAVALLAGVAVIVYIFFMLLTLTRFSMMLPAASIGRNMGPQEAWAATQPLGLSVLWAVILVGLFGAALQIFALAFVFSFVLFVLASAAAGLVGTLLTVSLATTIYGVAIEGRELT